MKRQIVFPGMVACFLLGAALTVFGEEPGLRQGLGEPSSGVASPAPLAALDPIDMELPAGDASMTPFLAAGRNKVYLSWLSKLDAPDAATSSHALRLSSWDGSRWSEPREIHRSDRFFANWADFSSLLVTPSGRLVVHWLEMAGEATYDYDIHFATSDDEGVSWSDPTKLHRDDVLSEHGFVSFVAHGADGFSAAWLDGRQMVHDGGGANEMSLRFTRFDGEVLGQELLLDSRVCECCQTGMASTDEGLVLVYRDRSPSEIRDISMLLYDGKTWGEPKTVHRDGWEIAGCPVNGPRVAALGNLLAIGWFTAENDQPRVQVVFSSDGGRSLSSPVLLEKETPVGRVDVVAFPARSEESKEVFAVSWLSRDTETHAGLKVALIDDEGLRETLHLGQTGASRASGFPRMAKWGNELLVAWTESYERGGASKIRAARVFIEN